MNKKKQQKSHVSFEFITLLISEKKWKNVQFFVTTVKLLN